MVEEVWSNIHYLAWSQADSHSFRSTRRRGFDGEEIPKIQLKTEICGDGRDLLEDVQHPRPAI